MPKIEKIKKRYENKKEIEITKANCKADYRKSVLENEIDLLPTRAKIKELKGTLKEPLTRKRVSNFILFVAVVMTLVSTLTTIAGGIDNYTRVLTQITFISFVSLAQLAILLISCLKPYLSDKADKYINISLFVQMCLLTASISYNYMFINNTDNKFIIFLNFVLCILFDLTYILLCEISFILRLNKKSYKSRNILNKLVSNLTFKFFNQIEQQYNANFVLDKDSETKTDYKQDVKVKELASFVLDKDTSKVKGAILSYSDDNLCPSISALMELTSLSRKKIIEIKKILEKDGLIETRGTKTYLKVSNK